MSWEEEMEEAREGDFRMFSLKLPKDMHEILRKKGNELRLPMARLILYALDNEFECGNPFDYEWEEPKTVFIDGAYNDEAHKLYKFLERYGAIGAPVELLLLMRRTIGIPNKQTMLLAIRELSKTTMVNASKIRPLGKFWSENGGINATWLRLNKTSIENIKNQREHLKKQKDKIDSKDATLQQKQNIITGREEWD